MNADSEFNRIFSILAKDLQKIVFKAKNKEIKNDSSTPLSSQENMSTVQPSLKFFNSKLRWNAEQFNPTFSSPAVQQSDARYKHYMQQGILYRHQSTISKYAITTNKPASRCMVVRRTQYN